MNPDDILIWPDGFWCFRDEFSDNFMRTDQFRVIPHQSDEWKKVEANGLPAKL